MSTIPRSKVMDRNELVYEVGGLKMPVVPVDDAATYSVLNTNSGKLHVIPDLTADIVITLPTPENGLVYEFMYGGAAADAQDWDIDCGSGYYIGGINWLDEDAADAEVTAVYSDGDSNDHLTVLTPEVGTWIKMVCDGTNWYVTGTAVSASAAGVAFSDT